jgi:hypothetical protein
MSTSKTVLYCASSELSLSRPWSLKLAIVNGRKRRASFLLAVSGRSKAKRYSPHIQFHVEILHHTRQRYTTNFFSNTSKVLFQASVAYSNHCGNIERISPTTAATMNADMFTDLTNWYPRDISGEDKWIQPTTHKPSGRDNNINRDPAGNRKLCSRVLIVDWNALN